MSANMFGNQVHMFEVFFSQSPEQNPAWVRFSQWNMICCLQLYLNLFHTWLNVFIQGLTRPIIITTINISKLLFEAQDPVGVHSMGRAQNAHNPTFPKSKLHGVFHWNTSKGKCNWFLFSFSVCYISVSDSLNHFLSWLTSSVCASD